MERTRAKKPAGKKPPMKVLPEEYSSVSEMIESLSEDPDFAREFEARVQDRLLTKNLSVLRNLANLSQKELADQLGCTQSKVSKLETGVDADLRFGDMIEYAKAVGYVPYLTFVPKGMTIADKVKMHALQIAEALPGLTEPDSPPILVESPTTE